MNQRLSVLTVSAILWLLTAFSACSPAPTWRQGEALYGIHCANCHMANGEGLAELYPPLAQASYLKEKNGELACLIRHGIEGPLEVNGVVFDMQMPGVPQLSATEITNIINYIHHSWSNDLRTVTLEEVTLQIKACEPQR